MILVILIISIFFFLRKQRKWDKIINSQFECGFISYFPSRCSFSIDYYLIGLIFLFLDLELCFLIPVFNEYSYDIRFSKLVFIFVIILLLGLLEEWKEGALDWKT